MDGILQRLFMDHYRSYQATQPMSRPMKQAAQALLARHTAAMGGHYQVCPEGHDLWVCYHACRHRSCPRCHALPAAQWVEGQKARLLACDHFHVVFTLPHELLEVWRYNRRWFTRAMFASSRETLFELLGDERYLGASPGVIMSFHSWGRTLSLHPHVHCLVTGGGVTAAGEWREVKNGYLLPAKVAKAVYRGKLLGALSEALANDDLALPHGVTPDSLQGQIRGLYRKEWNVRIQERYAHGRGVVLYLSRYVKGGPIQERRIAYHGGDQVSFSYTDHRDRQAKRMILTAEAFMTRILLHVPEPSQHQTRYYGLYHAKQHRLYGWDSLPSGKVSTATGRASSRNWAGTMPRSASVVDKRRCAAAIFGGIEIPTNRIDSLMKNHGFVQQVVRADADRHKPLFFSSSAALLN